MSTPDFSGLFSGAADTAAKTADAASSVGTALPNVANDASTVLQGVGNIAPAASSGGSWVDSAANFLSNNKWIPQLLAGGAGVGSLVKGMSTPKGQSQISATADMLKNTGGQLISSGVTGNLPPGQEQMYDTQLQQQIADIKAKYANMGLSGSSMEQQEIFAAQNAINSAKSSAALQATQTGASLLNEAGQNYGTIMQNQINQDNDLSDTIANLSKVFAS